MATEWSVSAYAIVKWNNGKIEISSVTMQNGLVTEDASILKLLNAFSKPVAIDVALQGFEPMDREKLGDYVVSLIKMGVLVPAQLSSDAASHNWHWTALAYHHYTRPPAAMKISGPGKETKPASIPLMKGHKTTTRDFVDVLESRQSRRKWPDASISFEILSGFFWLSCRNRYRTDDETGHTFISRSYPSGGAVHSLVHYVVAGMNAVDNLQGGIYRYMPDEHSLELITSSNESYVELLQYAGEAANAAKAPVVILTTSRFIEQSTTYNEFAYGLLLKEVGCLHQTFYLTAEYLSLSGCALTASAPYGQLAALCHSNEIVEPLIGEFLLGPR